MKRFSWTLRLALLAALWLSSLLPLGKAVAGELFYSPESNLAMTVDSLSELSSVGEVSQPDGVSAAVWDNIQEQIRQDVYRVEPAALDGASTMDYAYRAYNPAHNLDVLFLPSSGFLIVPGVSHGGEASVGARSGGLALRGYGYEESLRLL